MNASFAMLLRHEARLGWRDMVWMMTAGKRKRMIRAIISFLLFVIFMHWLSYVVLTQNALSVHAATDTQTLITVTASLLLSWMLMLSQAMETITRGFYIRGDLDLILASPANPKHVFGLRIAVNAVLVSFISIILLGPVINVLAVTDSPRWLAGYGVALTMGLSATAVAVLITVLLFHIAGPKRTRVLVQVLAAIVGAAFAIGIQTAAILHNGSFDRSAMLHSPELLSHAPGLNSWVWFPARATMGDARAFGFLLLAAVIFYVVVTWPLLGKFAHYSARAAGISQSTGPTKTRKEFSHLTPIEAMRQKEWRLLLRDPWLVSQTLMQLLYLLPPALLLWRDFSEDQKGILVCVPVLVMAAGQLAGGLTWITISGEDAPDLISTCPLSSRNIMAAKLHTVMRVIAMIFIPLVVIMAFESLWIALASGSGIIIAAVSSVIIQLWFRSQSKRSAFRRRHTASRIATFTEAFCCIAWAGTATLIAMKTWLAVMPAIFALLILIVGRLLRPHKSTAIYEVIR